MASKKRVNSSRLGRVRGRAKKIKHRNEKRGKPTEVLYHSTKEIKVERALIENFIGLQKVMVGMTAKFDTLSTQISSLLQLFENSARTLARKEAMASENLDAKKVLEKLDRLSSQAGLIGKGLALIHEVGAEERKSIMAVTGAPMRPSIMSSPMPAQIRPTNNQIKPLVPVQKPSEKPMVREIDSDKKSEPNAP